MGKPCIGFVFVILLTISGCTFYKPGFRGKVIDADTGEPIEGAAVVAIYQARVYMSYCIPAFAGPNDVEIYAKETLTDEEGMFYIPPYFTIMLPVALGVATDFVIFKPGYGKCVPCGFSGSSTEKFFSEKIGDRGELQDYDVNKGKIMVPVTFGVAKLSKTNTWEERRKSSSFLLHCYGKCPLLQEMLDREEEWLYQNKGWIR